MFAGKRLELIEYAKIFRVQKDIALRIQTTTLSSLVEKREKFSKWFTFSAFILRFVLF